MGNLSPGSHSAVNGPTWVRWCGLALVLLSMAWGILSQAQTEYDVKAVFLCRFAQYVEWPPTAFASATAPITIGILGDDPFGKAIEEASADERPQNRKCVIKRFNRPEDLTPCHILFISRSEQGNVPALLQALDARPILTVGDTEQFTREGGMINFTTQGGKIRFEINPKAANEAGLKISAQLLRLAKIVE